MQKKRPPSGSDGLGLGFTAYVWALLRAGMCHGVTPLPFLAHSWPSTGGCCRTAGACRRRLLTIDACRRLSTQLLLIQFRLIWAIHAHANEGKHCKLRTIPNTTAGFFLTIGLQSYHLWQLCNKEPKFYTTEPIKAKIAQNSPKLSIVGFPAEHTVSRRRLMGCVMTNGIATYGSLPHEYYVLKMNGRINSIHRRYQDALRAGLLLKNQFPHDDIKVWEVTEEAKQDTVLH